MMAKKIAPFHRSAVPVGGVAVALCISPVGSEPGGDCAGRLPPTKQQVPPITAATSVKRKQATQVVADDEHAKAEVPS